MFPVPKQVGCFLQGDQSGSQVEQSQVEGRIGSGGNELTHQACRVTGPAYGQLAGCDQVWFRMGKVE